MATFFNDLGSAFVGGESVYPQACAASTNAINGASKDMLGADGNVFGYMTIGTVSASTINIAAKLQESDTGTGSWTDITSAAFTAVTESATATSVWITNAYRSKRYVRAVVGITGTSVTSVPIQISVLSMKKVLGNSGAITS